MAALSPRQEWFASKVAAEITRLGLSEDEAVAALCVAISSIIGLRSSSRAELHGTCSQIMGFIRSRAEAVAYEFYKIPPP